MWESSVDWETLTLQSAGVKAECLFTLNTSSILNLERRGYERQSSLETGRRGLIACLWQQKGAQLRASPPQPLPRGCRNVGCQSLPGICHSPASRSYHLVLIMVQSVLLASLPFLPPPSSEDPSLHSSSQADLLNHLFHNVFLVRLTV